MTRIAVFILTIGTITGLGHAHFLFVHVLGGDRPRTEIHFAESCWDFSADPRMVSMISNVRAWSPDDSSLDTSQSPYAIVTPAPDHGVACAAFTYGLMRRGESFLLEYEAKGVDGLEQASTPSGLVAEILATPMDDRLFLTVLHHGRPAPGAEIVVPDGPTAVETLATDSSGRLEIPMPRTPLFGIRARVSESRDGAYEGEPFDQVRYYTTLTVHASDAKTGIVGDPLAGAILADAASCSAVAATPPVSWRGRIQGRVGSRDVRGTVVSSRDGTRISMPDSTPASVREGIEMLEGFRGTGTTAPGNAVLDDDRKAAPDLVIVLPQNDAVVRVADRRIVSTSYPIETGRRRIDVLDWSLDPEQRHLPTRVLVTDFADDDRMNRSAIVTSTFSSDAEPRVPDRFAGTLIGRLGADERFSVQLTDVRLDTP